MVIMTYRVPLVHADMKNREEEAAHGLLTVAIM